MATKGVIHLISALIVCSLIWVLPVAGQTTFFSSNADSPTTIIPPWTDGGTCIDTAKISRVTTIVQQGTHSWRFEVNPTCSDGCSQSESQCQFIKRRLWETAGWNNQAYYSFWGYINAGLADVDGNIMEFKADITASGTGSGPKAAIRAVNLGAGRRLVLGVSGCEITGSTGIIVGQSLADCQWQQPSAGALTLPFQQWFHLEMFLKASTTNGVVKVWQDGTLIFHISHANLNTLTRTTGTIHNRSALQWMIGLYQHHSNSQQVLYIDDAKVTSSQVGAGDSTIPNPPTNLTVTQTATDTTRIEWTKPTQNTNASSYTDAEGFDLRWCTNTACTPPNPSGNVITLANTPTGCTPNAPADMCYIHTGRVANTVYGYDVLARDTSDNRSATSGIEYATTPTGPPPTLRAHYDMEDGPTGTLMDDQTANNFDGTLYEGTTSATQGPTWVTGQVGTYALQCDGVNDSVQVADTANLDITGDMTITFWLKLLATTNLNASTPPIVLAKETSASPFTTAYAVYVAESANPHLGYFHLPGTNNQFDAFTSFTSYTVPLNTWIHVAFTRNVTTRSIRLYVDGNFQQALTYGTDNPAATATPLMLCSGQSRSATQFSNIALDDVRILSDIMSDPDILTLAQGATGTSTLEASICRWRNIDTTETQAFQRPVGYEGQVVKGQSVQLRCGIHNSGALSPSFAPRLACRSPATSGTYFTVTDSCATNPLCLGTNVLRTAVQGTQERLTVAGATFQAGGKFIPRGGGDWFINVAADSWMEFEWPLQLKAGAGELDLDDTIGCKVIDHTAADLDTVTEIVGRVVDHGGYSN